MIQLLRVPFSILLFHHYLYLWFYYCSSFRSFVDAGEISYTYPLFGWNGLWDSQSGRKCARIPTKTLAHPNGLCCGTCLLAAILTGPVRLTRRAQHTPFIRGLLLVLGSFQIQYQSLQNYAFVSSCVYTNYLNLIHSSFATRPHLMRKEISYLIIYV